MTFEIKSMSGMLTMERRSIEAKNQISLGILDGVRRTYQSKWFYILLWYGRETPKAKAMFCFYLPVRSAHCISRERGTHKRW